MGAFVIPIDRIINLLYLVIRARGFLTEDEVRDYLQLGLFATRRIVEALSNVDSVECIAGICAEKNSVVNLGTRKFYNGVATIPYNSLEDGHYTCIVDGAPTRCRLYSSMYKDGYRRRRLYVKGCNGEHHVIVLKRSS